MWVLQQAHQYEMAALVATGSTVFGRSRIQRAVRPLRCVESPVLTSARTPLR